MSVFQSEKILLQYVLNLSFNEKWQMRINLVKVVGNFEKKFEQKILNRLIT